MALSKIKRPGFSDKSARLAWGMVWLLLYRPSPVPLHFWRCFLLRLFGARIGAGAHPYPSARIWAPWNLVMGRDSCLAEGVECYNVARIRLGDRAIVSQRSFLCTASHDYDSSDFALIGTPIDLGDDCWVAAEAFIAPGVMIGAGSVVLARAVVTRDVDSWMVVGGNPAKGIRSRRRDGKVMAKP